MLKRGPEKTSCTRLEKTCCEDVLSMTCGKEVSTKCAVERCCKEERCQEVVQRSMLQGTVVKKWCEEASHRSVENVERRVEQKRCQEVL